MKYDDASWHYGGDFPEELPDEAGGTHIAMFLTWCLLNDLTGELHISEFPDYLNRLKRRDISPGKFFFDVCDGKFTNEDVNEIGNKFTNYYFHFKSGQYLVDYSEEFLDYKSVYSVDDDWKNYDRIQPYISAAFKRWLNKHKV